MELISLVDFFLPRICFCCNNKLLPEEKYVCTVCHLKFKYADKARLTFEFKKKFINKGIINAFFSYLIFEKDKEVQHLIHALKYSGRFKAGSYLGEQTAMASLSIIESWKIDIIIPVPLHKLKQIQRGYNQSLYIAKGISRVTGIPLHNKIIIRKKNTLSQTAMNIAQREDNIRDAFLLKKPQLIKDRNILLADDVITTGSTLNECGRVLLEGGASGVYAVSAAIADLEKIFSDTDIDHQ
jgi:ComF family protein